MTADPRADARIAVLAARQHGVVSRRQLAEHGLGRGAIARRVRAGRLHRLHRGVFGVGYRPITREGGWMAAALAYGRRAGISHTSGLALWGLRESAEARIHVTIATHNGLAARPGVRLHRCATLAPGELTTHRAIPVTSVARTLLDSAPLLTRAALARAVERSESIRLFDLSAVRRTLDLHPTHPGARRLEAAIALFREDEITRSDLEAMMIALCDGHALPRPLVNHVVEGEEVDFLWPRQRLIAETDGRATHLTRAAFERDRARDARLTVAGYRVVRFTYRQIVHDRGAVATTLTALLPQERSISSIR